jgi:predicted TPR repeat methyltransferase
VLWDYLPKSIQYLGIEPSAKAAASACERYAWDRVLHITAEQFDPGERQWDCIVFNEVLYYCSHPLSLLEKYAKAASSEGIIIVSIYQKPGTPLKQRLRYLLSPNRPLSNQHCTKMVREFIVRHGWRIEEDNLVARPGSSGTWWICAAKPCVS